MKLTMLKRKLYFYIGFILMLLLSYSLCPTHEKPTSGYISKRKRFCSMPFYIIVIISLTFLFFFK